MLLFYNKRYKSSKFRVWFLLIIMLSVAGCSTRNKQKIPKQFRTLKNLKTFTTNQQADTVQLIQQKVYGSKSKVLIGRMGGIAVDSSGRLYIADLKRLNIKVYGTNGHFLTTLGRHGKGPGEFTNISSIQINDNRLYVYNDRLQRVDIFSLDSLAFIKTILLAANENDYKELRGAFPSKFYVLKKNSFLMEFDHPIPIQDISRWDKIKKRSSYYFIGAGGQVKSNKLFNHTSAINIMVPFPGTGRAVGMHIKFFNKLLLAPSGDGLIYTAWTKNFLIKVFNAEGIYQQAFYYPYKRISLTRKSAIESGTAKFIVDGMQSMDLPKAWPALHSMKIDSQGRLWISTIIKNAKVYQWWVLNKDGKLLARFAWPRDKKIKVVKNGKLYTVEKNKKGVARVVRYKIQMQ